MVTVGQDSTQKGDLGRFTTEREVQRNEHFRRTIRK